MKGKNKDLLMENRAFGWVSVATLVILLMPFIAMQFTKEVDWSLADFMVVGTLIFGMGCLFVILARKVQKHRIVLGIIILAATLYIWAELAVGIFTNLGS